MYNKKVNQLLRSVAKCELWYRWFKGWLRGTKVSLIPYIYYDPTQIYTKAYSALAAVTEWLEVHTTSP